MKLLIILLFISSTLFAQTKSYHSVVKSKRKPNTNQIPNIRFIDQTGEIEIIPHLLQVIINPDGAKSDTIKCDKIQADGQRVIFFYNGYYGTLSPAVMTIYSKNYITHYRLKPES